MLVLIGGALLLGIGPFAAGSGGPSQRVPTPYEERAERIEGRLTKNPGDERTLLALTRAWIGAGNQRLRGVNTETQPIPNAISEDFKAGLRAWNRYLRQADGEAGGDIAELAGGTFFSLVEIGSTDPSEAKANAAGAARAQRIAGKLRPTLYTLSLVAVYEYFNGEYAAGDRAARGAAADVKKSESKGVIEQLGEYRERGERFIARVKRGAEELQESGEEELETPLKGYGAPAGINGYEPSS